MKITIAGYGFVGRAHYELLKDTNDITIYDPALGYENFGEPDAVIVCVSTPQRPDGACEVSNVFDVCGRVSDNVPVLIKSTMSVEGWDALVDTYPNALICFSPEFLREKTWLEDIKGMDKLLIGGNCVNFWAGIFKLDTEVADPRELILAKYFRNSFLATKVAFFNQMYDLCKEIGIEYEAVAHYTGMDERIGHSHTTVTNERGYGGHCLPKDVAALIKSAEKHGVDLSILKEAVIYNNNVRVKSI